MNRIEEYRQFIKATYPNAKWHKKVDQMPANQVIAIYYKMFPIENPEMELPVKIIKHGKLGTDKILSEYETRKRFYCEWCHCRFEADVGYYETIPDRTLDGFISYALCPECCAPAYETNRYFSPLEDDDTDE